MTTTANNSKQYFSFGPEEGLKLHDTLRQAHDSAHNDIAEYRADACTDGWHDDVKDVCYGIVASRAQMIDIGPDVESGQWVVNYVLSAPVVTDFDSKTMAEELGHENDVLRKQLEALTHCIVGLRAAFISDHGVEEAWKPLIAAYEIVKGGVK